MIEDTLKKIVELEKSYKRINLLERKKERMGLDEEEESRLMEIIETYNKECEDLVMNIVEFLINQMISDDGMESLIKINGYVEWNGKKKMSIEDFEKVLDRQMELSAEDINNIEEELQRLHRDIFKGFEDFCKSEGIYEFFNQLGQTIINDERGDIIDVVSYIDSIYKDFAEIFGIELSEIKLFFY